MTVARPLSGSFTSIAPGSIDGFGAAQLVGGALAYGLVRLLYPEAAAVATRITAEPPAPRLAEEPT